MSLGPGTTIGPFKIQSLLGRGGMGEVFSALDTRLDRKVAIKILPRDFASDSDRLRRFEAEAKTLASLNHPNILVIHEVGTDGTPYLVSELLDGRTLREELNSGPPPLRKSIDYALQIAHGLAAAHTRGIIHRDLKPENIFITKDGRVKILDFGLAKPNPVGADVRRLTSPENQSEPPHVCSCDENAPTLLQSTIPGLLLGTPGYMSPEQVRSEPADARSDIFAFGCVLYEIVSGSRAFHRSTAVETMNAILKEELPALPGSIPHVLRLVFEHCLEKDPANRFQSSRDLAFALMLTNTLPASEPGVRRNPSSLQIKPAFLAVADLLLLATSLWWWETRVHTPAAPPPFNTATVRAASEKSVAVQPFVNMSPDKADEYLSDGMTEELLNALAKIKGLRVPGRSSSFAFKGKNEEGIFRKMGEELHVGTVLEGSVRKAGEKLRITAQLINVADGFHLWSETYDRDMTNIFAIQSDIAARVAEALQVRLLGNSSTPKPPTENLEAYKYYLQGRQLWNQRRGGSIKESIIYFNRAIAADSGFATAYSGLADAYNILADYSGTPTIESVPKARAAAEQALRLDPTLGEPHAVLASIQANFDWNWPGAEAEFRRAIELNPNYATAHHWFSTALEVQRRFPEALSEARRARELDPLSPIISILEPLFLIESGDTGRGMALLREVIREHPSFIHARSQLAKNYADLGRYELALNELAPALDPDDPMDLACRAFAQARLGRTAEARQDLARLGELERQGQAVNFPSAWVQYGLGDLNETFDRLDRALAGHETGLSNLNTMHDWQNLRSHPRVQAILRKMNLLP